ncbi:MAG: hypothetical protein JO192_07810, partial [Candidatus Eremiobacteraeota bacterium]|nr:hypothetical protein [Candidatus Eremiobacteraeota bacterium]
MFRNRNFNVSLVNTLTIAAVAIGVLWLDQYTKHLVVTSFLPGESRMVIPHLLKWTYERNFHGAFGMFGSS